MTPAAEGASPEGAPSGGSEAPEEPDALDPLERRSGAYRALVAAERVASCGLLVATFVVVLLQVITRYVFDNPLSWTEELARFLLIWLTFVGAGYVMARRLHVAVDLLVARLGRRGRVAVDVVALVVVLVSSATMAVAGAGFAAANASLRAPATDLSMAVVYAAAVVGFALVLLHGLVHLWSDLRHPESVPEPRAAAERESF